MIGYFSFLLLVVFIRFLSIMSILSIISLNGIYQLAQNIIRRFFVTAPKHRL